MAYGKIKTFNCFLLLIMSFLVGVSFWIFSRFTVDDAFITWRYGKNLVEQGVWGYNPVHFDLTQAYTNPIYAVVSIIPELLDLDVVLFFKISSLACIAIFAFWFYRKTKMSVFVAFVYAIPATFIHAFSGLETFLYVCLLTVFFVSLIEDDFFKIILYSLALFMTRPESWILLALVPFYFALPRKLDELSLVKDFRFLTSILLCFDCYRLKRALIAFFLLAVPMAFYFSFHKIYFGYALPNTFYVKSGGGFHLLNFLYFSFVAFPIFGILLVGKHRAFLTASLFFFAVIFSYSTSTLMMNYIDRFAFHIIFPSCFILVYIGTNFFDYNRSDFRVGCCKWWKGICSRSVLISIAFFWFFVFFVKNFSVTSLVHIANYYPRALDAHAQLGKAIAVEADEQGIDSMSMGDAGMAAYHAGITSYDNIGLGSSLVAHEGVNQNTLDAYEPEVIVFHAWPTSIMFSSNGQDKIYSWAEDRGYRHICQVYWKSNYTLNVYSKYEVNNIESVCESSRIANDVDDSLYIIRNASVAPWIYWKG
ncbi:hypothetical protein NFG57_08590 [Halomonas sp. H10-59]|uniref:Glycosyltransferase RgtA/B/C/D-like domain-containing protein n=1 Tax=Halomonas sp. H10-59 TaxID=2950874 RepID=A0AAU7KZ25_9GAMM